MPTWEDVMGARERYEGVVSHEGMMAFRGPIAGISRDGKTIVLATARTLSRREMGNGLAKAEHDWHEVAPIMTRTGADALPIVALITFLIGFVMAFQSAAQLKQFGAVQLMSGLMGAFSQL